MRRYLSLFLMIVTAGCTSDENKMPQDVGNNVSKFMKGTFGYDVDVLTQHHKDIVVLGDHLGAQVVIAPGYQGRVMSSSAEGTKGISFGWINHDLIASGKRTEHMNAVGGEERFWLGPEGGQFSIYFKKGAAFKFENWFVPKEIDTEPFDLVSATKDQAAFRKEMQLENYSGNKFDLEVQRTIRLLNPASIDIALGVPLPEDVLVVGFESNNTITNKGATAWNKQTGMLSIWILSMLNATDETTVVIPYRQGDVAELGKIVTDDYFGRVPQDRLKVDSGLILFKADAKHRSKIGISPKRAIALVASYDAINSVLTIAQFSLPQGATDYVNSLWMIQNDPFEGDAVNSYNDGPIDTTQMGKFYEIESSSPAAALKPGESLQHMHRTIHIQGAKEQLNKISQQLLGVNVDSIRL